MKGIITKLLVANRGEIALRVMRSAHEMGIKTVAIYSEADRRAPHVLFADEAVCVGPAPSAQSYLKGDLIISVAKDLGVDAIHPGYGFLSENAEFARAVEQAGIRFIGPRPHAIEVMGDKLSAKDAVKDFEVPLVPGTDGEVTDVQEALELAEGIGFPVMIKASAGGGGKGMRIVEDPSEFESQMKRAVSEATNSFGNGAVFVEKYIQNPRHIEIQILADEHGNVVHLFERECSIQRRHQKVIEEAPSVVLTSELRDAMGKAAVNVAKACDYRGAGTVEFIFEPGGHFYFLEMNTRLQVEHPVTEQITGRDLVKEQIRIAEGHPLSFKQEDLAILGHSIEVRVYAEDASANFMPATGTLREYRRPQGLGIRVDDGLEQGMEVSIYYDPMIAKLITFGATREDAIARMKRAIKEYRIAGVQTTLDFAQFVLNHEAFVSGNFDTHFVANHFNEHTLDNESAELESVAAAALADLLQGKKSAQKTAVHATTSTWKSNRS
ncbi:MAG: Biotin carboxylase [Cryomorphaceae bacterium]|nr:MAG: Biotin carboxylase [Cryomorphaceae bacterium]